MKTLITLTALIMPTVCSCQEIQSRSYEFNVEVTNDSGIPIKDAFVTASKDVLRGTKPIPFSEPVRFTANTNNEGVAKLAFDSVHQPGGILVEKSGYYLSTSHANWLPLAEGAGSTTEIKTVLKPVKNPIPMVFHSSTGLHLREIGKEYALDLELGEMLPPYGNGKVPDILVKLEGQRMDNGPDQEEDIEFKATLRFSNPLDGFIEFEVEPKDGAKGSAFISDYLAPENGYQSSLERIAVQGKFLIRDRNAPYLLKLDRKAYYFRLRTKTDDNGKIISSNYGKIYGPINLHAGKKRKIFHPTILEAGLSIKDVYFNPNANDRNIECDTSKNLSKKTDEYGSSIRIDRP